jgi:DNA-binding protein HU-beta
MRKVDLVAVVKEKAGITKKEAEKAVNAVFDAIAEGIASEGRVQIAGFGTFSVVEKKEREVKCGFLGGKKVKVPARKSVKFTPFKALKEKVNG